MIVVKNSKDPDWVKRNKPGQGRKAKYPIRDLQVGESLLVPVVDSTGNFQSFRSLVSKTGQLIGRRFKCRVLENGTFEVYRLADRDGE